MRFKGSLDILDINPLLFCEHSDLWLVFSSPEDTNILNQGYIEQKSTLVLWDGFISIAILGI